MMDMLHDTNVWVAISFTIFFVAAMVFAKDKFFAMLDGRIEEIKKEIEVAENLRVEAQELLALYQRKQRDARKEAEEIVTVAKAHAEQIKKDADKELKALAKRREEQLTERLALMEQSAIDDIKNYAANLAMSATKEIVTNKMSSKTNQSLVDSSIKDLDRYIQ